MIWQRFDGADPVPFAVGGVHGLRAFGVARRNGRFALIAPIQQFTYEPGENEAECTFYGPDDAKPRRSEHRIRRAEWQSRRGQEHRIAGMDCSCGFYAFWHGANHHWTPSSVAAVVQGYGLVTYGADGFRCAKLKILAAVNPWLGLGAPTRYGQTVDQLNLRDPQEPRDRRERLFKALGSWVMPLSYGVFVWLVISMILTHISIWFLSLTVPFQGLVTYAALSGWQWRDLVRRRRAKNDDAVTMALSSAPGYWIGNEREHSRGMAYNEYIYDELAKAYPEIKWYASQAEMLHDFPLTTYNDLPHPPGIRKRLV